MELLVVEILAMVFELSVIGPLFGGIFEVCSVFVLEYVAVERLFLPGMLCAPFVFDASCVVEFSLSDLALVLLLVFPITQLVDVDVI